MSQSYIKNLSRPRLVRTQYSAALIRNSNSVPLVVLPALGANRIILPIDAILDFHAGVDYSGTLVYTLGWAGGSAAGVFASVHDVNAVQYLDAAAVIGVTATPVAALGNVNKGISLTAAANRTTGTGTIIFTMIYRVYTVGG